MLPEWYSNNPNWALQLGVDESLANRPAFVYFSGQMTMQRSSVHATVKIELLTGQVCVVVTKPK
jgi:hypothetical protein